MTRAAPAREMSILKYIPEGLYGFAADDSGQVFFHLGSFDPGGPWMFHPRCSTCPKEGCPWGHTSPPPVLGEPVQVELGDTPAGDGQAPRAVKVTRIHAPLTVEGFVVAFDAPRGFGFIRGTDEVSYHLHRCEMVDGRLPQLGQRVMFYAGMRQGKPRACHARICL